MRSRLDNGSTMEQRVLVMMNKIKEEIEFNPGKGLSFKCRGAMHDCVKALKSTGIIINNGTRLSPLYRWQEGVKANQRLANKITNIIRDERRKNYSALKAQLATIEISGNIKQVPNNTDKSIFVLAKFSDQELWDELKSRQYQIENNKLCKMTYLI